MAALGVGTTSARLLAAAGALLLAACGPDAPSEPTRGDESPRPQAALGDADYLLRLGLMRGHLLVGNALYESGARDAGRAHSKHPTDELYAGKEQEFAARGTQGFAAELEAHAAASAGEDATAVAASYAAVVQAIARCEQVVTTDDALVAEVIVALLRTAAEEYAIGIKGGQTANAHEYQDAYGFTQVALDWAQQRAPAKAAFNGIARRIEALEDMWPALVPPPEVPHAAARLYGAAAETEIAALSL